MVAVNEELKSIVNKYRELRLKVIDESKKLDDISLILFKSFLQYVKENRDKSFHELLNDFLSELGLDSKEDLSIRLSLIKRFYKLVGKRVRDEKFQTSLLPYLE